MSAPKALVLTGDGINCERETAFALERAGFEARILHLNDVVGAGLSGAAIRGVRLVALPGGFSFGDDLTSGKVLALKIRHVLEWDFKTFAAQGGLVIGICNGFQALIKLGIFDTAGAESDASAKGRVSITQNRDGRFLNRWVGLKTVGQRSGWLKGIETLESPIRHGEGRLVFESTGAAQRALASGQACLQYVDDPNGSEQRIAGMCDETGRILGLMPHPEAFVRRTQHPQWTLNPPGPDEDRAGDGLQIFKNAFEMTL